MGKKDIKGRLIESAGPNFDPKISLCHSYLAIIKSKTASYFSSGGTLETSIHELLDCAYVSERETEVAQTELIDELERFLCSTHPSTTGIRLAAAGLAHARQSLKLDRTILMNSESHSILELCVRHGLSIYMKHRLEQEPSLLSSRQWHQPLLSHAFFPVRMGTKHRSIDPTAIVRVLLDHGADPNAVDGDSTTWRRFVNNMIDNPSKPKLELMDLLLSNGADPSAGSVLLETLTILSTSPAKVYQMSMFDKLLDSGANPNSTYDDSTIWKRYLRYLLYSKGGLMNRNILRDEFKQMKRLLLSGADPNATANGKKLDLIIEETFGVYHATELLDLVSQKRLHTDGGFLSRIWKVSWRRRSAQPTGCENDWAA